MTTPVQARYRLGADQDERATPWDLLAECAGLAGVDAWDLDVAATPDNAKAAAHYGPDADGLTSPWWGRVWCNPPYSAIAPWVTKAAGEIARPGGPSIIGMLIPANRTEQPWWQTGIEPGRHSGALTVHFLARRRGFLWPGELAPRTSPPFGLALVVWRRP